MERDPKFTIEDAIAWQDLHLADWKVLLNDKVYQELHDAVKATNEGQTDPYAITRGCDLDSWLANYKHEYSPF